MVWLREGRWITRHTARGFPYVDWEPPVPRLRDQVLDCVVYLYPTKAAAEDGAGSGGSGFLLRVPCLLLRGYHYNFVVTNRHVTAEGSNFIRLNTKDGRTDIIEAPKERIFESEADDLSIIFMPTIPYAYVINAIPRECLITREFLTEYGIGIGDDALLVGRFISRGGEQKNTPTVRFGQIAQMLGDPIQVTIDGKNHVQEEAFLVEVRSIGGFSGSPVFILPNPFVNRNGGKRLPEDTGIILGVDFCHLRNWMHAHDKNGHEIKDILVPENTGMAGVIPAWKVEELLSSKKVQDFLRQNEEEAMVKLPSAVADSSSPPSSDENPTHREDFTRLLDAAAKTPPQED